MGQMNREEQIKRYEWIEHGIKQGWVSEIRCVTHEGPTNYEEHYEDEDLCYFVLEILPHD